MFSRDKESRPMVLVGKWYNLRYILKVKMREFASEFNVNYEMVVFFFQYIEYEMSIRHPKGDMKKTS